MINPDKLIIGSLYRPLTNYHMLGNNPCLIFETWYTDINIGKVYIFYNVTMNRKEYLTREFILTHDFIKLK